MVLGTLFTTANGHILKDLPAGDLFIDFRNGTITDSAGTVTLLNTNLDYYGLTQAKSFAVFVSDFLSDVDALAIADADADADADAEAEAENHCHYSLA